MQSENQPSTTVRFATAPDGLKLCFDAVSQGEPTIVFIHGWSCDRHYWRFQVDHFKHSHGVLVLDLGGHGDSGCDRKDWAMSTFGEDVNSILESLNIRNSILVGHSMGGFVAVEAARKLQSKVLGIVAVDIFNNVDRRWPPDELERYLAPIRADFSTAVQSIVRSYFPETSDKNLVDWIAADMAAAPPETAVSVLEMARKYDQGAGLASVDTPAHFINSDFWPTDLVAARRHNPNIHLTVMHGLGHFPMLEAPERFNLILDHVIGQLSERRSTSA